MGVRAALEVLAERADRCGVFVDFDGSLSEIAPTPDDAVAVPGASEVLRKLARRFAVVAIVTGRRMAEVAGRLGNPEGVRIFGLYGGEREGDADSNLAPRLKSLAEAIPGVLVEPKGPNVAVHYRLVADPERARASILEVLSQLAAETDLTLIEGKMVVELAPASAPTKGDLVAREAQGLDAILYAGDDVADLEAFAALDRLGEAGAHAVKVVVRSRETPEALLAAADLTVEGPAGLVALLRELAG